MLLTFQKPRLGGNQATQAGLEIFSQRKCSETLDNFRAFRENEAGVASEAGETGKTGGFGRQWNRGCQRRFGEGGADPHGRNNRVFVSTRGCFWGIITIFFGKTEEFSNTLPFEISRQRTIMGYALQRGALRSGVANSGQTNEKR